jgi:transcriptional regulator with XRE-family HTH domain
MANRELTDVVFGMVMRQRRKAAGYTQEQLGLECGLTRVYISMLELGDNSPTLRTMVRLAKCFGVSVGDLILEFDVAYEAKVNQSKNIT